jgi:excisionase family DNA binding protein
MVQYYTLQEAAARLQVSPEQLKEMAKKNEVRAFQDRGTLRFRAQEIDELARVRGLSSDPELQLGDFAGPKSGGPKSPAKAGPKTPRATKHVPPAHVTETDFTVPAEEPSEEVPLGRDPASAAGGSKSAPRSTRSPAPKHSPRPVPGSDSDVRLVGDGGALDFQVDSDVKVESAAPSAGPKTPGSKKSKVDLGGDSGVRIVPLDDANDSDVKIVPDDPHDNLVPLGQGKVKTPSDSDIRLEQLPSDSDKRRDDKDLITDEIDVDAESLKAAQETAARKKAAKPRPREGAGSSAQLPTVSPFELSDHDVNLESGDKPPASSQSSNVEPVAGKKDLSDSSSDFDLALGKDPTSSPLELGSDELAPIRLDDSDEQDVGLGELTSRGASGINLEGPVDSGISLEEGGSEEMMEEVHVAGQTPRPTSGKVDSSSDFELSVDDSDLSSPTEASSPHEEEEAASDSEFELTLDDAAAADEEGTSSEFELSLDLESSEVVEGAKQEGDSEFELTLDEGGPSGSDEIPTSEGEDKDIFETDFEVPALDDEESGSEAVALDEESDTDLEGESSEFDLPVDEEEETEAESGSEVVALDEDVDELESAPPRKKGRRTVVQPEDEEEPADFEELDESEAAAVEEEEAVAAAPPRSWGFVAPMSMVFCSFIMFFVCLMTYEMIAALWGYHRGMPATSFIVAPLARTFDDTLPKE